MTRLQAGPSGVLIPRKDERFFFLQNFQTNCRALSQEAEQQGCATDHTPSSHAKVSGEWRLRPYSPTHIPSMQWDCSYLHHHITMSCSGATIVSKGILIYISVYSKYLKFMTKFFTHSSVCHQFNEDDSPWCLYNLTLLFLFPSREFFFSISDWVSKYNKHLFTFHFKYSPVIS